MLVPLVALLAVGCGARSEDRRDPDAGATAEPVAEVVDAGPCGLAHVQCDGLCIDPARDAEFCGARGDCVGEAAGQTCPPEHACLGGQCTRVCPAGKVECLGTCIDPLGDDAHCGAADCAAGAIGVACSDDERCARGACVPRCEPGLLACDGDCIDPLRDRRHCGARGSCAGEEAGQACEPERMCVGGICALGCPGGYVECEGRCVDPLTDAAHCGALAGCQDAAAGVACDAGQTCVLGRCEVSCPAELLRCGLRCVDPRFDPIHCGADGDCRQQRAGVACAQEQYCDDGQCRAQCPAGELSCDGGCTDPLSDPAHCGAAGDCNGALAGEVCAPGRVCSDGVCIDACPPNTIDCGGGCIDPRSDRRHCGARGDCGGDDAGERCAPLELCVDGVCTPSCGGPLRRCDDLCTDVSSDRFHCGGCGAACAPGQDCFEGVCRALCPPALPGEPDQVLCDGQCIDPRSDPDYCGASGLCVGEAAGQACQESERCEDGSCVPICEFAFCAGVCTDILVDPEDCGSCGRSCDAVERCSDGDCRCAVHVRTDGDDGASGNDWARAKRTLGAAVAAAQQRGCAVWVAGGRYLVDDADREATIVLGEDLRIYGGFAGDELRLDDRDVDAHPTVLSGDIGIPGDTVDNTRTLVTCLADLGCDAGSVLDGLTLEAASRRGMVVIGADVTLRAVRFVGNLGGGLHVEDASPDVDGCSFEDNFADEGGGIRFVSGGGRIANTRFVGNFAVDAGGGLLIEEAAAPGLRALHFERNFAENGGGIHTAETSFVEGGRFIANRAESGGAIEGSVVVEGAELVDNEALDGAGINGRGVVRITDTVLRGNRAADRGGAVRMSAFDRYERLQVDRCRFDDNAATHGGAIRFDAMGEVAIDNSRFLSNEAISGSGLSVRRASLRVGTSTFVGNRQGAAIDQDGGEGRVDNSILWDNGANPVRLTAGAGRTTHSLVEVGCGPGCGRSEAILTGDPRLSSPGGGDLRLRADSPCIDAGDDGAVPNGVRLDLDRRARFVDGPDDDALATVDMGAHEYSP